ncbi:hypothetical protein QFC19_007330 [Naganishia cerealis]|uniref:Uncharacterized protein n=1 Tax=Naganishia cerealis TaxID=610337 RepID=A0ACC2VAT8_9TREE|nr:hypothetical protein QFC19_007330 [Naganishia cerealis]
MLERLIFYIYSRLVAKGVLPEVRDETLSKVLDPPRTKGRPPKNSLLDQYKAQHPDIAAVVKAKPQSTGVKANTYSSSLTTVEPLVSAETNGAEAAPPTTPATVPSLLPVPAQTPSQSNDGGSAAQGTAVQGVSPNSLPTPSRISHAAGQSRLIAPPPPLTFPQVEIPDKIRGLDDQDEINIEENAKARDELDKVLDKWPGPAENIPAEVNDEGNRIPGSGWWGDEYHGQLENWQQLAMEIIEKLRTYLDTE